MNTKHDVRSPLQRELLRRLTPLVLLGTALPALSQSGDPRIEASYRTEVQDVNTGVNETAADRFQSPPIPLDVNVDIEPGSAANGQGIWMFGNETGRTRVSVETVRDSLRGTGEAKLYWSQIYQKNSDLDRPRYTVNPTVLEYFFDREATFDFSLTYECYDSRKNARKGKHRWQREAISQRSRIGRRFGEKDEGFFHSKGRLNGQAIENGPLPKDENLLIPAAGRVNGIVRRTTKTFRGDLDISDCGVGEFYKVIYVLEATAEDVGSESGARAFLGDPLEVDTGFELEPAGAEDEGPPPQFCRARRNALRYVDNLDGTVTDTETSLVWQRCPTGYVLNDGGTVDELGDDSCTIDSTGQMTWQDSLGLADSDDFAGQTDWRLPNIKELDSVTDLNCIGPAIQPGLFPDTPLEPFWSATPDANDPLAVKAIDAHEGNILSLKKTGEHHARLVRDSGASPLAPPVRVTLKEALPAEESSGELRFTVGLSRIADADVLVDYSALDGSAAANDDYLPTSGTLVISAGAQTGIISVPLVDDDIAEEHERLEIELLSASANAWIDTDVAGGEILDDEPRVTIRSLAQFEGLPVENNELVFLIELDRPANSRIELEFSTRDGSATLADSDYVSTSGIAALEQGSQQAVISVPIVGDRTPEGDEALTLAIAEPLQPNALLLTPRVVGVIVDDEAAPINLLNDSGVGDCTNDSLIETSCPQSDFPGQDAEYGIDAFANDDSDGYAGLSLTKLDSAGVALADQTVDYATTPWSCVEDLVTARIWEVKADDGDLRDRDWRYTWYTSSGHSDGGDPGTEDGGACLGSRCDTEGYVAAVNAAALCGYDDWRLPTREELLSLDINRSGGSGFDSNYFPFARASTLNFWWSLTPAIYFDFQQTDFRNDFAWYAAIFDEVGLQTSAKSTAMHVRLVRDHRP